MFLMVSIKTKDLLNYQSQFWHLNWPGLNINCFISVWRKSRGIKTRIEETDTAVLAQMLKDFYQEARNAKGELYSENTMRAIRSGLDRHLTAVHKKTFSIIHDSIFEEANQSLKFLISKGLIQPTKPVGPIDKNDLVRLFRSDQIGTNTPQALLQTIWFYFLLYFGKYSVEHQRNLTVEDISLGMTVEGQNYVALRNVCPRKGSKRTSRPLMMREWPGHPLCPVACMKKYLSKRNPIIQAFWQRPKDEHASNFSCDSSVWYCNAAVGRQRFGEILSSMCQKAHTKCLYQQTSITITPLELVKAAADESLNVPPVRVLTRYKPIAPYPLHPDSVKANSR